MRFLKIFIPKTFKLRVILLILCAALYISAVSIFSLYSHERVFITDTLKQSLDNNVSVIHNSLAEYIIYDDIYDMFILTENLLNSFPFIENVYVLNSRKGYITDGKVTGYFDDSAERLVEYPVTTGELEKLIGFIVFEIKNDYEKNIAEANALRLSAFSIAFAAILLVVSFFFISLLIKPVEQINKQVSEMSIDTLGSSFDMPVHTSDEIMRVARSLAELTTNLKESIRRNIEQEKEIMRAEKMASIGMMSAGLAHELKNPAMTILLLSQTLKEDLSGKYGRDLDVIERGINHIVSIINDFLTISKPVEFNITEIPLEIIEESVASYSAINFYNGMELKISSFLEKNSLVADAEKIVQILQNLLNNSYEAGATEANIIFEEDQHNYIINVRDNGIGIEPEIKQELFRPFFTTKSTGTGLGLYYIDMLLNNMGGGSIELEDSLSGAAFKIKLRKNLS